MGMNHILTMPKLPRAIERDLANDTTVLRGAPDSPFPYVQLIRLTPERIVVTPSTFDDERP